MEDEPKAWRSWGERRRGGGRKYDVPMDQRLTDEQRDMAAQYSGYAINIAKRRTTHPSHVDDRIQDGQLCLIRAAQVFDPSLSTFSTYAYHRVFAGVLSSEQAATRAAAERCYESIDLIPQSALSGCGRADNAGPGVEAVRAEMQARVREAVAALPDRLRYVITSRIYGGMTLKEVGASLGVTRERARQIEETAHRKLRWALRDYDERT